MPCLAGFLPVLIDVQATAETSGREEFISIALPRSNIRARLGRSPDCIKRRSNGRGEPSQPSMNSLFGREDLKSFKNLLTFHPASEWLLAARRRHCLLYTSD